MNNNFVDYVKICCRSGAGGAGSMHFHRAKGNPNGGPDGGDGGKGGSIILRGNTQLWTLLHLKFRKHVIADPGGKGDSGLKTGATGKDVILDVPLGTVVRDVETEEILFEITKDGEEKVLVPGGRGGKGNNHFKTSTRQAPHYAQPGEAGREEWKVLELKVLADVGLVGFPNAGKSTLLSVITAAKPEIANYPFTTIVPNLGIVAYRDYKSFIMADIPGIIEGAHLGKGLGIRFLKHIERNSILLFLIPADSPSIKKEYKVLMNELKEFNPELLDKEMILGISKCDLVSESELKKLKKKLPTDIETIFFSSHTQNGLTELKDKIWSTLTKIR